MKNNLVSETTSTSESYVKELESKIDLLIAQKVDLQCKVKLLQQKINAFKVTSKF